MSNNEVLKHLIKKYSSNKSTKPSRPLQGINIQTGEIFVIPFNNPIDRSHSNYKKNRK
ncbi:hypothetical protein ACM26V_04520 [Salipaludibacillus sp. HK11]|uniref:hypothetical protein n=1 Tax=Salipaludibacillus sp. HK11 TaxID=3394320 RepID=UPI0039FC358C